MEEAHGRLDTEQTGWLTTVSPAGQPQSSPVWFLWQEGVILVASEPQARKVGNASASPRVAFHLEGASPGTLVVTVEGSAEVGSASIPAAPYG
jgi:PPOX class probable F420-dependent enzyme